MKRLLAIFLLFSMLISSMTIISSADEETSEVEYEEEVFFNETKSFASASSTSVMRWNTNYAGSGLSTISTVKDPLNADNLVGFYGYKNAGGTGPLKKEKGFSSSLQTLISADFMIPTTTTGYAACSKYTFNMFGVTLLTIEQSSGTTYNLKFGGTLIGTMTAGVWAHFDFHYNPDASFETNSKGTVELTFKGDGIQDTSKTAVDSLVKEYTFTTSKTCSFEILTQVPSTLASDTWYGWYLDNTTMTVWNIVVPPVVIPQEDMVQYDEKWVMPDAYNTGYRTELVPIAEKYPDLVAANYVIDDKLAAKYNYEFCGFTGTIPAITVNTTKSVTLHDFYMESTHYWAFANKGTATLYIEHMEGVGSTSAFFATSNIVCRYCHVHDCVADILKGNDNNMTFEFCYFHDAGTRSPGAHADGIQFTGDEENYINNIKMIGCRIDMPQLEYEHLANCCFFYSPESGREGYYNVQAVGNWFNGGGYTTYLLGSATGIENNMYLVYNYNKIGNGWKFGPITVSGWTKSGTLDVDLSPSEGSFVGNEIESKLDVGSIVFYDGETRLSSISESTSGSLKMLLNFANYNLSEHGYKISYELQDSTGKIVIEEDLTGSIRRYISPKEYDVSTNMREITVGTTKVTELINLPDLPSNVPVEVTLEDLPTDLTGYTLSVIVEDTTASSWIRSTTFGTTQVENTIKTLPEGLTYTVTFKGKDGSTLKTQKVQAGKAASAPTAPKYFGYAFNSWDVSFDNVSQDLVVTALYDEVPTYQVTYTDLEGTILKQETLEDGSKISGYSIKAPTGYVFDSWVSGETIISKETAIHETITLKPTFKIQESAFTNALDEYKNASTYTEKLQALQSAKALLTLWGEDADNLNESVFSAYTNNVQEYSTIQESIESDLNAIESLF